MLRMKLSLFCVERVSFVNSERLIMQMADRLAEDGYRDAGYIYVSIDVSSLSGLQKFVFVAFALTVKLDFPNYSYLHFAFFLYFDRIAGPIRSETLLVIFNQTVHDFQVE